MSRYLFLPFAALLLAGIIGCETTKLQRDMLEDSTWETSEGEEDWGRGQTSQSQGEEAKRGLGEEEHPDGRGAALRGVGAREQSRSAVPARV